MKLVALFLTVFLSIAVISCNNTRTTKNSSASASPDVKKGVKPIADPEIAVIEMENAAAFGTIKIELYSNIAPEMVARFKKLANEGFYDGVTFHRVSEIVVQGGDPNSKDDNPNNDGQGNSPYPNVNAEFSDVPFERGSVGAARLGNNVNSQNCQFFITLQRYPSWDKNYTLFGKVIEGMNNAVLIAGVPKDGERPLDPVRIRHISIVPGGQ
jgi:cyclophilin family peptidyl-prolyl cis-trans isomerase